MLASLAPDRFGPFGVWTSGHDSALVWLMLLEAFLLPLLLCSIDSQFGRAFRRSLTSKSSPPPTTITTTTKMPIHIKTNNKQQIGHKANSLQTNLGSKNIIGNGNNNDSYYLDYIYICGKQQQQNSTRINASNNKTCQQLLIDETLGANFRLMTRASSNMMQQQNNDYFGDKFNKKTNRHCLSNGCSLQTRLVVGTADLHASRRARYRELMLNEKKRAKLAKKSCKQTSNAQISLTRNLLLNSSSNYANNDDKLHSNNKQKNMIDREKKQAHLKEDPNFEQVNLSPTSSLSTLIRKFNQDDNYANSVCNQPKTIATAYVDVCPDKTNTINSNTKEHLNENISKPKHELLLETKGGLSYNYDLVKENISLLNNANDGNQVSTKQQQHCFDEQLSACTGERQLLNLSSDNDDANVSSGNLVDSNCMLLSSTSPSNLIENNKCESLSNDNSNCHEEQMSSPVDFVIENNNNNNNISNVRDLLNRMQNLIGNEKQTNGNDNNNDDFSMTHKATIENLSNCSKETIDVEQCKNEEIVAGQSLAHSSNGRPKMRKYTQVIATAQELQAIRQQNKEKQTTISESTKTIDNIRAEQLANNVTTTILGSNNNEHQLVAVKSLENADICLQLSDKPQKSTTTISENTSLNQDNLQELVANSSSQIATKKQSSNFLQQLESFKLTTNSNYNTLDYASIRSVEDCLSLVSVSSEFEYHNIANNNNATNFDCEQQRAIDGPTRSIKKMIPEKSTLKQAKVAIVPEAKLQVNQDLATNLANDMRFPSFLTNYETSTTTGNKQQIVANASNGGPMSGKSSNANQITNHQQVIPTSSSSPNKSLLNLTNAKFANVMQNVQQNLSSKQSIGEQLAINKENINDSELARVLIGQTIIKQKGAPVASSCLPSNDQREQHLMPGSNSETKLLANGFGWRQQNGSTNKKITDKQQQLAKSSLPAENGNVKARIKIFQGQNNQNATNLNLNQNNFTRSDLLSENNNMVVADKQQRTTAQASLIPKPLGLIRSGPSASSNSELSSRFNKQNKPINTRYNNDKRQLSNDLPSSSSSNKNSKSKEDLGAKFVIGITRNRFN